MLTHLRIFAVSAAALCVVGIGQAFAFWPFAGPVRMSLAPAYGGVCEDCDLSGRILVGARMSNSTFNRSNFSDAVLVGIDATDSRFEGANFTEADLERARFVRASLVGARFRGARLNEANFSGADLRSSEGLTQQQLSTACGDADTRVRRGLHVPACE